jgi:hypothetical protein
MLPLMDSGSETYVVLLDLEPSSQINAVGFERTPVDVLLSRLGPIAELGESFSGDLDLLNGKSDRADDLTMLVGIGLQCTAESCNLLGQVVGDGGGDGGDNIVRKTQNVTKQTGSRGSKDCRAGGGEKESRRSHLVARVCGMNQVLE